jgi:hypothetical protein
MIDKNGIEEIKKILPCGWEEKAYELEAITRSRVIKSAEELLILNLLYQTSGKSLGGTSSILKSSGEIELSKQAVGERIVKSMEWNRWLCENISRNAGILGEKPSWLKYRRVLTADGTEESRTGSKGADYRLHYLMDLFTLETIEMKLTDYREGEKLSQYTEIQPGDIVVADKMYGTLKSIEYALSCGCDYVLRLKTNSFNLYDKNGVQTDIARKIENMQQGTCTELKLHYKKGKNLHPVRLCIYRKTDKENVNSEKQLIKSNNSKVIDRNHLSDNQKFYCKYVIVATSMSETPAQILALYRQRWQIELLFKRLKSIFNLDELPAKKDDSVKAWFYGKLLLAAICEALDNKGRFSPRR